MKSSKKFPFASYTGKIMKHRNHTVWLVTGKLGFGWYDIKPLMPTSIFCPGGVFLKHIITVSLRWEFFPGDNYSSPGSIAVDVCVGFRVCFCLTFTCSWSPFASLDTLLASWYKTGLEYRREVVVSVSISLQTERSYTKELEERQENTLL